MRRRTRPVVAPESLCRFVASEWAGGVREWGRACLDWLAEDPDRRLPFGDDGDALDVLRVQARLTLETAGGPPPK